MGSKLSKNFEALVLDRASRMRAGVKKTGAKIFKNEGNNLKM